jgi:hypothetical protein
VVSNVEIRDKLREVVAFRFESKRHIATGWNGVGFGIVKVSKPAPNVLIFDESGSWQQDGGKEIRFTNVFRWSFLGDRLQLDHLRFGANNPVFLFEMATDAKGIWREINPYQCGTDFYRASLHTENERIFVTWSVRGPKRDTIIDYVYIGRGTDMSL